MQRDGGPGGAGAGNPTGGSFTGPAEMLELVGDHAYAYTGLKALSTAASNQLSFTTGNYYFFGRVYFNGGATEGSSGGGGSTLKVSLNGSAVALMRVLSSADDQPSTVYNDIIIPAYTLTQFRVDSVSNESALSSVLLVGRIYRG